MIFDANTSLGQSLYGPRATVEQLLDRMDAVGIDRSIVSSFTPRDLDLRRANHAVSEIVASNPRLVGFARIDPRLGQKSIAELEACQREGFRGVKVDPFEQAFVINSDLVFDFFKECAAAKIPTLIVSGYPCLSSPIQVGDLAERIPELTIIMAHGGQLAMHGLGIFDCLLVVKATERVFVETSGIPETGTEGLIERSVLEVSTDRVIFGSNSPVNDPAMELERIRVSRIPEDAKNRIMGANLAAILGL
jgi:predicted TIM-barrel fold metal-dependent hydrolase